MELYEMDSFNPYHNQVLLAFIKVLYTIESEDKFLKMQLIQQIKSQITGSSDYSDELIEELVVEACNHSLLKKHCIKDEDTNRTSIRYSKSVSQPIQLPLSAPEKLYLKNMLSTPYARLFLEDSTITKILSKLTDLPDMDLWQHIDYRGVASDPVFRDKDVTDIRMLSQAICEKRMIRYVNHAHNGRIYRGTAVPVKIEFSVTRRHFWLSTWNTVEKRPVKFDLSRIQELELLEPIPAEEYAAAMNMMEQRKEEHPIIMEIKNQRQAIERASLMFSMYEKQASFIDEDTLRMEVYYYTFDERELIENILSFGPAIRVLEPVKIVEQIMDILRNASF